MMLCLVECPCHGVAPDGGVVYIILLRTSAIIGFGSWKHCCWIPVEWADGGTGLRISTCGTIDRGRKTSIAKIN